MTGPQLGLIIPAAFGGIWAIAGTAGLSAPSRNIGVAAALAISAVLVFAALKAPLRTDGYFDSTVYGVSVALEVVAIVAAVVFLNRAHQPSFILPVIAVIVGLHFIGMWRATQNFLFVWLACVLCAVGAAALPFPPLARAPVAGIGAALALWGAVAVTLLKV